MSETKIKDHIGLIQNAFGELLTKMFSSIETIQRDANSNSDNSNIQNQVLKMATEIVEKVKQVDALIDEANEKTFIGKDTYEIENSLRQKSEEYEKEVLTLGEQTNKAEILLDRIKEMLDVIAKNTPWMQQCSNN